MPQRPKIIFAGNRMIAVQILELLISEGINPLALLLPTQGKESHNAEMKDLCGFLQTDHILYGDEFRQPDGVELISRLEPDYIICIHFPYIIPAQVLSIPRIGVLNLHPAYLPFNRGWHTPSWAILTETPIGGTLHFMDENIDTGDIIHQKAVEVLPEDTADSLYNRILETEYEVFKEALPSLIDSSFNRISQKDLEGSIHTKEDLLADDIRKLDLDKVERTGELLKVLKALTTNRVDESAFIDIDGQRYYIQIKITRDENYEK